MSMLRALVRAWNQTRQHFRSTRKEEEPNRTNPHSNNAGSLADCDSDNCEPRLIPQLQLNSQAIRLDEEGGIEPTSTLIPLEVLHQNPDSSRFELSARQDKTLLKVTPNTSRRVSEVSASEDSIRFESCEQSYAKSEFSDTDSENSEDGQEGSQCQCVTF